MTNQERLQRNNAKIEAINQMIKNIKPSEGEVSYNFERYLVNYVSNDDGSCDMLISDYVEGGEGEILLIGTLTDDFGTELYILDY